MTQWWGSLRLAGVELACVVCVTVWVKRQWGHSSVFFLVISSTSVLWSPVGQSSPLQQPRGMCDILSIGTCHRYWPRKREKPTWGTCEAFPPTEQSFGLSQRNSGRRWRLRRSPRGQMGQGLREADKQRDRNKTAEEPNKISNVLSLIMLHEEFVWATRGYVQHSLQIVAQSHSF